MTSVDVVQEAAETLYYLGGETAQVSIPTKRASLQERVKQSVSDAHISQALRAAGVHSHIEKKRPTQRF